MTEHEPQYPPDTEVNYIDDEMPPVTYADIYWHYANRWGEWCMSYIRLCGIRIGKIPMRCENRMCKETATVHKTIRDERVGHAVRVHVCSDDCAEMEAALRATDADTARLVGGLDIAS